MGSPKVYKNFKFGFDDLCEQPTKEKHLPDANLEIHFTSVSFPISILKASKRLSLGR